MPLVQLQDVQKHYALGDTWILALHGIDLSIDRGEFVAVWGPSGSGKSTLCNLIGLIDAPTQGTVWLHSVNTGQLSEDRKSEFRNEEIGFVFQGFNLIPVLSAIENVMLPLEIRGGSAKQIRGKAFQRLEALGLAQHADHRPAKLSGGQQQRVAIARALITDPSLVIADEPTANLDSSNAHQIIDLMRQLNYQHGTTFVFSTHDQRLLERVERLIRLEDGRIVEDHKAEF